MGITEADITAINEGDYDPFDEKERAVLLWAEHVTLNTARERDDVFQEVKKHFTDTEIVELTMVITYFNMRNKFNDALGIPIEAQEEIDRNKIRRKNPDDLKAYLEALLADWPDEFPEAGSGA
ncbi:MAG: carboxymuconolactone decarboxylase family protein [Nitrospinae bacterium]|nr:carboxymuconolactone decarboxylase family protein [Nitrospinota bacterium]